MRGGSLVYAVISSKRGYGCSVLPWRRHEYPPLFLNSWNLRMQRTFPGIAGNLALMRNKNMAVSGSGTSLLIGTYEYSNAVVVRHMYAFGRHGIRQHSISPVQCPSPVPARSLGSWHLWDPSPLSLTINFPLQQAAELHHASDVQGRFAPSKRRTPPEGRTSQLRDRSQTGM